MRTKNGLHPIDRTVGRVDFSGASVRIAAREGETTDAREGTFSREFKLDVARQVVTGAKRPAQACREYGLADSLLMRWRKEYEERSEVAVHAPAAVAGGWAGG